MKFLPLLLLFLMSGVAYGFGPEGGACGGDCQTCHQLTKQEAANIVKGVNPQVNVLEVGSGPVRGLWELVIESGGKKGLAYIDFSKQHIITGSVINVSTKENLTGKKLYEMSRIDPSAIPVKNAIVLGKADAKYRVIVFDDPD